jgi:DnaJ-class molecular chaperone
MPDIAITSEWQCPSCNGTGEFKAPKPAACFFCNGTGDQREMPQAWRDCPSRNRVAYHESLQ